MNIKHLHPADKGVSAKPAFKADNCSAVSIQILKGDQLKEHITKTPAFLVCISGSVIFENEEGLTETLVSGDFILIEPNIKHWVDGLKDSQLLLVR
ncbi:hypothetical protein OAD66_04140 [Bacteroidia bacterium]|nr:hypothetical protein [Bacteroidia bacterium]